MNEQDLLISTIQKSSVFSSWEILLEIEQQGFYGYGYGDTNNYGIIGIHGTGLFTANLNSPPYSGSLNGYVESNLGWIPGDSIVCRFDDIFQIVYGTVFSYDYVTGYISISVSSHTSPISGSGIFGKLLSPYPPALNYFNVIGLGYTTLGYGYRSASSPSNITNFEYSYSYGWGYEYNDFIIADDESKMKIVATVKKNGILSPNIRVDFFADAGVIIESDSFPIFTDSSGQAIIYVKMNPEVLINKIDGWGVETSLDRNVPISLRELISSGSRTVTATIYEKPEVDDSNLNISLVSEQKFYEEIVYDLEFSSYAFNEGEIF